MSGEGVHGLVPISGAGVVLVSQGIDIVNVCEHHAVTCEVCSGCSTSANVVSGRVCECSCNACDVSAIAGGRMGTVNITRETSEENENGCKRKVVETGDVLRIEGIKRSRPVGMLLGDVQCGSPPEKSVPKTSDGGSTISVRGFEEGHDCRTLLGTVVTDMPVSASSQARSTNERLPGSSFMVVDESLGPAEGCAGVSQGSGVLPSLTPSRVIPRGPLVLNFETGDVMVASDRELATTFTVFHDQEGVRTHGRRTEYRSSYPQGNRKRTLEGNVQGHYARKRRGMVLPPNMSTGGSRRTAVQSLAADHRDVDIHSQICSVALSSSCIVPDTFSTVTSTLRGVENQGSRNVRIPGEVPLSYLAASRAQSSLASSNEVTCEPYSTRKYSTRVADSPSSDMLDVFGQQGLEQMHGRVFEPLSHVSLNERQPVPRSSRLGSSASTSQRMGADSGQHVSQDRVGERTFAATTGVDATSVSSAPQQGALVNSLW